MLSGSFPSYPQQALLARTLQPAGAAHVHEVSTADSLAATELSQSHNFADPPNFSRVEVKTEKI